MTIPELAVLPTIDAPADSPERPPPTDHPMRVRTEAIVAGDPWDGDLALATAAFFDDLAGGWNERFADEEHDAPLTDAFDRGGIAGAARCLELGSGTGLTTPWLADRCTRVVAADLSLAMLREAPATLAPRVRGDGARLPFPDGAFDGIALINTFLFADEAARVLAPEGWLLWVNTLGDRTPIHLPAERVLEALPGSWAGVTATCGIAIWLVARRGQGPSGPEPACEPTGGPEPHQ